MACDKYCVLRIEREQNVEVLRQAALILEREHTRLVEKNIELTRKLLALQGADPAELPLRLHALEAQLAQRNQKLFGDSSEKRQRAAVPPAARTPQTGHGPREQHALAVVEQIHTLDPPDQTCPTCGGVLGEWHGQFEEAEEIDVIERRFVVKTHRRQKYRCGCGCLETAPGPQKLFPGARYAIDFAIEVATQKYLDHLPLERQVRVMAREGLAVDSQTLWDQLDALARVLAPAHTALHAHVLKQPVIGVDETRWRLMGAKGRDEGEAKRWQVWAVAAPDAVSYQIHDSRSTDAARHVLRNVGGIAIADGYGVYDTLSRERGGFVLANCWAHVRRKYVEIRDFFPQQTEVILDLIGALYAVEKLCPTGPPGDDLRRQLRDERSREIVSRIHTWALAQRRLPESGLGKAIAYMSGMWKGLVRFLDDPRIPLDNNGTERALRGVVLGRKNHYGSRSRRGTEVAALLYSLAESAKLAGLEPKAYLRQAAHAALRGEAIPLPPESAANL